jgi:hypothetical protein
MQKLSTTATVASAETLTEKWINFENLHFFTYNIEKKKKKYWNLIL